MSVRLEVKNGEAAKAHKDKIKEAENALEEFVTDFKERTMRAPTRPAPSGRFAPRKMNQTAFEYIQYHALIARANNDLFSSIINDIQDALGKVDFDVFDHKIQNVHTTMRDTEEDSIKRCKGAQAEATKATKLAKEALELLQDAHARMDEMDEVLDELA